MHLMSTFRLRSKHGGHERMSSAISPSMIIEPERVTPQPAAPQPVTEVRSQGLYDVTFTYPNGGVKALGNLTLEIPEGKTIGVVGPSGCGKSTLLSLLANLAQPDSGRVVRATPQPGRHPMAMVFQKDTLLPW